MADDINKKEFTEETKLKLEIFKECFREWYPVFIHHKSIRRVYIYDMFAGSGMDTKGNLGSPLILLNEAKGENSKHCNFLSSNGSPQIIFGFNEYIDEKKKELEKNVKEHMFNCSKGCNKVCPFKDHIFIENKDFSTLMRSVNLIGNMNNGNYAKFVLLDQYGFKKIDDEVFQQLISFPKTDFIFFIASSFIKRFSDLPAVTKYLHSKKIQFSNKSPKECHRVITEYFRSLIPQDKEYYLHSFTIQKGANYYGLIFGTSHTLGMEKFIKVCWKHDNLSGESNCNIDNDYEKDSLFYDGTHTIKKDNVLEEIKNTILSGKIKDNYTGLKYALERGCEPSLYIRAITELMNADKVSINGKFNKQATNIHKVELYSITIK